MRARRFATFAAVAALAVSACGGGATPTPAPSVPTSVGTGEGRLDLIAWPGYVVGGTGGEQVEGYDWVTDFETASGCKVYVKPAGSSDEMVTLMQSGQYDGVSASGDATLRLIRGGEVAAVNLDLIPNYANVFEGLKNQPHNTVDGVSYGVPHGRGANVLAWNTQELGDSLDSWSIVFDPASKAAGKLSLYGSPIYIADAAVYLMATQPDLGIKDPYSLDDKQFKAAVDLLKSIRPNVGEFWADATKQINSFAGGNVWAGTTWQYQVNTLLANNPPAPIKAVLPKEGSTGWSDTWMISSTAAHPNCMYKWMDYIISPVPNANATVYFGEAPVSADGCVEAEKLSPGHCETFHAEDEAYFDKVYLWNTPSKTCIDGRGDICVDYNEWTKAWTEIQG
jgi:putative spermidine/putrescine transport system substrate-binding protein